MLERLGTGRWEIEEHLNCASATWSANSRGSVTFKLCVKERREILEACAADKNE